MGKLYDDYFVKPQKRAAVTKTLRAVTEIKPASRKVGRPLKENALTAAERAKAYRERKRNA